MSVQLGKITMAVLLLSLAISVNAEDAKLSVVADLVIHPEDISTVLQRSVAELNRKSILDWDVTDVTSPLKARLLAVKTVNPFEMAMDELDPVRHTVQFAANWENPGINIGRMEIDDKIKRTVNGINIVLELKAACENLQMRIPGGQWRMSGELKWHWVGHRPIFEISQFSLYAQPAKVDVDFGQCEVPQDLRMEMQSGVIRVLTENSRLQEVFKQGLLNWVNGRFSNMEKELTTPREYRSANNLSLKWIPNEMTSTQGVIVVRGRMDLTRSGLSKASFASVGRDFAMGEAYKIPKSGFILPKAALLAIANFVYRSELVNRRISSRSIEGLRSLMESRFAQIFVWPDLQRFPTNTEFWFDLSASAVPTVQGAVTSGNGIAVATVIPLALKQWAPDGKSYVPYVNFASQGVGAVNLKVSAAKFNVSFAVDKLNLTYAYDPIYVATHKKVKTDIKIKSFEEKIEDSLLKKAWEFQLPELILPGKQKLGLSGIEIVPQGVLLRMDSWTDGPPRAPAATRPKANSSSSPLLQPLARTRRGSNK